MAISNKPLLWVPFAAGGMVAALFTPALITITGLLVPAGILDLPYDRIMAWLRHPLARLIMFGLVAMPMWHAAHRMRMTAHDLGLGGGPSVKVACYGSAIAVVLAAAVALAAI